MQNVFGGLSFNVPTLGALYQDATWRLINEKCRTVADLAGMPGTDLEAFKNPPAGPGVASRSLLGRRTRIRNERPGVRKSGPGKSRRPHVNCQAAREFTEAYVKSIIYWCLAPRRASEISFV